MSFREQLDRYLRIAHHRFETERFEEFCDTHLAHLDEVAYEYFASAPGEGGRGGQGRGSLSGARGGRVHRAVLGPDPAVSGRRAAREPSGSGGGMKLKTSWWSPRLEQEVNVCRWGEVGAPVLLFPTAGGDAEERSNGSR